MIHEVFTSYYPMKSPNYNDGIIFFKKKRKLDKNMSVFKTT